jgi:hypothetical protein
MGDPRISLLKLYLQSFLPSLPEPAHNSPLNQLLKFNVNPEWVKNLGSEKAAINCGLEVALKEYLP